MHTTTLEPGSRARAVAAEYATACHSDTHSGANGPEMGGKAVARVHRKGGRRAERFDLLATLQRISTVDRVVACGWRRIDKHTGPSVVVNAGVAHMAGTQRCGSVWMCPVCGPKIRQGRAEELDTALSRWMHTHGTGSVQLWTMTQPHTSGEPLRDLRATIKAAWRAICSGRTWQAARATFGIAHTVTALDVTHGANGWHPHLHIVVLTNAATNDEDLAALHRYVLQQWDRALTRRGRAKPHPVHGVQIERAKSRADVGRYVCQVIGETDDDAKGWGIAQEAARTDLKASRAFGHRTPWQILADIRKRRRRDAEWDALDEQRDARDLALWHEYEIAMKHARAVSFSRGLRAAVGLDAEKTDEELAESEVGGEVVAVIESRKEWAAVRLTRGGMVRLLRVAESHAEPGVRRLLAAMLRRHRHRREVQNEPYTPPPHQPGTRHERRNSGTE